jgi:ABC-type transport system involved in multi-copper enzyme maturation permease subunit
MNSSIIIMTVKQLMNRPARMLILVCFACFPLITDFMVKQMDHGHSLSSSAVVSNAGMSALIISAGIIGQDVSDGILPLIFSRPIKRWHYVVSKWMTVSCLASALTFIALIVHLLFCYGFSSDAIKNFAVVDLFQIIILSAGTTSVIMMLSSLLPGAADIGIILLVLAGTFLMMLLEEGLHVPGMIDVATNITAVIFPSFDISDIKTWRDLFSIEVGRYFAIVLVCLSASVVLVNQKEFSYAN